MSIQLNNAVIAASACVALFGCGGGGGGGGSGSPASTPTNTFSPQPVGTNVTLRNPTNTQTMTAYSILAADPAPLGVRPVSLAEDTEFSVTFRPGTTNPTTNFQVTTAIASPSMGVSLTQTFTTENGLSLTVNDANMIQRVFVLPNPPPNPAHSALITNVPGNSPNLSYQLFGLWSSSQSTPNHGVGVFSVGNVVTQATAIPTSASAVFNGTMSGFVDTNVNTTAADTFFFFTARVRAEAFFADRRVEFTSSNTLLRNDLAATATPVLNASFDLAGTLRWTAGVNKFQGTVSNGALTGTATGRFYGPNAEELGGVLHATDGNRQMAGAFGAAK